MFHDLKHPPFTFAPSSEMSSRICEWAILKKAEAENSMDAKILKVLKCGEKISVQSEKADNKVLDKRTLVLQELGGKYENKYVVTAFGTLATLRFEDGCLVAATLRFQTHEHNGAEYQDVVANDIVAI